MGSLMGLAWRWQKRIPWPPLCLSLFLLQVVAASVSLDGGTAVLYHRASGRVFVGDRHTLRGFAGDTLTQQLSVALDDPTPCHVFGSGTFSLSEGAAYGTTNLVCSQHQDQTACQAVPDRACTWDGACREPFFSSECGGNSYVAFCRLVRPVLGSPCVGQQTTPIVASPFTSPYVPHFIAVECCRRDLAAYYRATIVTPVTSALRVPAPPLRFPPQVYADAAGGRHDVHGVQLHRAVPAPCRG